MEPRKTNFRFLGNKQVYFSLPVQAQRRENSLDFFMFVLGFFLVQNFPGMRGGVQLFTRGGVQKLISIKFDRTCDLPGMGSGPSTPLPLDLHMYAI